jgi:hypothetical protein
MQAIELNTVITQNHKIHLKLPDYLTASHAKVIVMYENNLKDTINQLANLTDSHNLSRFAGCIKSDDLALMTQAIKQECEGLI